MISFDKFVLTTEKPIYLQLLIYIKSGISSGIICDKDELPSRRVLSAMLGINPNTVQKAYKILEEEKLIKSHPGAKSYINITENTMEKIKNELIEDMMIETITSFKQIGLSKKTTLDLIQKFWNGD